MILVFSGVAVLGVYGSGYILAGLLRGTSAISEILLLGQQLPRFRAHVPASTFVEAICACAKAHRAVGEARVGELPTVSASVTRASRTVLRAHRTRGVVTWLKPSHRRTALKEHAKLVVGKLQEVERELDKEPDRALRELAELLLRIAERYAQGRVGVLLDEQELQNVSAVRYRTGDGLRAAVAVALTIVTVFSVASLDLPQAIEGYVIAGSGAAVLITVYGPQVIVEYRRRR
ncbi:hypothetical protein ACTWQF_25385 [Streptomyces sp. 8N114]|uniref:hypothetical protein n=1 Tax=Streptomyces sp. 8N114 TaxID=3457419 RepID=UPI003FD67015